MRTVQLAAAAVAVGIVFLTAPVRAGGVGEVEQAIERATLERIGPAAVRAEVALVSATAQGEHSLVAVPDPQGTVGTPTRFSLLVGGKRVGSAVATVRVRAQVVRTSKFVARHEALDEAALSVAEEDVTGSRYARLPLLADVLGGRARRDLERASAVSSGIVVMDPAVRTGDRVRVELTVGHIHITADGVASGSGEVGDVVRVLPAGRRAMLKARVTERGVVEVMP